MRLCALVLFFLALVHSVFAAETSAEIASSRIALEKNWHIQSECKVKEDGAAISRSGYSTAGWLATTVPHTVLGAQVDAKIFPDPFFGMNLRAIPGMTYPIGKIFTELPMPDDSPYKCAWWYRTEFHLPSQFQGKNVWLHFDGINYRANVWVNGKQIATSDQVAGAYRTYEFNVKDASHFGAANAIAVEVFAQTETDLGINFVDWNPMPADKAMGLWRPVYLTTSGPVSVRYPAVSTHFPEDSLKTAELTVTGELQNATAEPVSGMVEAVLEGIGKLSQPVTLAPNERQSVVFTSEQYPQLRVQNPKLWWPHPLGPQNLYTIEMRFVVGGTAKVASIHASQAHPSTVILSAAFARRTSRDDSDLNAGSKALLRRTAVYRPKSRPAGIYDLNIAGDPSPNGTAQDDNALERSAFPNRAIYSKSVILSAVFARRTSRDDSGLNAGSRALLRRTAVYRPKSRASGVDDLRIAGDPSPNGTTQDDSPKEKPAFPNRAIYSKSVILSAVFARRTSRDDADLNADGRALLRRTAVYGPKSRASGIYDLNIAGDPSANIRPQDDSFWENRTELSGSADLISDSAAATFGIREITDEKNPNGYEVLHINHHNILIRGGGWAPDMFLRVNDERMENEFRHVRNLGLNTIRLEGKMETDEFFNLADRYGILVMAGWCCCDHWEHWDKWTAADHEISKASQTSQILRLRSHPSLLVWLNGSDNPPPDDVESDYISILKQYRWPNPYISSASATPTTVTGPSGVKMTGPYDYVPPSYWLTDPGHWGGAYGFNTETSPGPAPPLLSSIEKFIPKQNLWPHDDVWNFHAGLGSFGQTKIFDDAMTATYGAPTSLDDYERKSQAMAYDGERAMFEAFARNKYNSTGVIQWMLNNAWPAVIWHLYDYYLVPGGGYFGVKKAMEPVHAQYSYDDRSVVVVNSLYVPQNGLKVHIKALDLSSKVRFSDTKTVDIDADSVTKVLTIPDIDDLNSPYFVQLELTDSAGKGLSSNFYWLPKQLAELDWENSNYYTTPAKYADMTALSTLPVTNIEWNSLVATAGANEMVRVTLRNAGKSLALLVHVELKNGRTGSDLAPVFWDDNYISLLPGESRTLAAAFEERELGGVSPQISVQGWNVKAENAVKTSR